MSWYEMYDGLFYEGQDVSYNDLMRLVAVTDWEDDYKNSLVAKYQEVKAELEGQHRTAEIDRLIAEVDAELDALSKTTSYISGRNLVVQLKFISYHVGNDTVMNTDLSGNNWSFPAGYTGSDLTLSNREQTYKDLKLDTSTKRIDFTKKDTDFEGVAYTGRFTVTYTVTDYGIDSTLRDGLKVAGVAVDPKVYEPVTVTYTRDCKILYNDLPYLSVNDVMLKNTDPVLDSADALFKYLCGNQRAVDRQDIMENSIWWVDKELGSGKSVVTHNKEVAHQLYNTWYERYNKDAGKDNVDGSLWYNNWSTSNPSEKYTDGAAYPNINTRYHLQDRIVIKKARVISVNKAFEDAHPDEAAKLYALSGMDEIFGFNGKAKPKYFKYIESVAVVYDVFDQFGKYAGGDYSTYGASKGVEDSPVDRKQPEDDREAVLVLVDSENDIQLLSNYTRTNVRYIAQGFLYTLGGGGLNAGSSYFNTSSYGLDALKKAFAVAKNPDAHLSGTYRISYVDKNGHTVNVTVYDYDR